MPIQFTIIGLGQIGSSIGLALASQKADVTRIGHDKSNQTAREAQKLGAVDKIDYNLPSSVENADVILLCVPADQVKETLTHMAQDLKEDAVVLDFSPIKGAATGWAREILPAKRYYIGLTPGINPDHLHILEEGVKSARADLFQKGTMLINAPQGTPEGVAKLAANLCAILGSRAVFVDTEEVDSLMASIHILPQLTAAALLDIIVDQSGWRESRMIAGHVFARSANALVEENGLSEAVVLNKKHTLRTLDTMIASLQSLRSEIEAEDIPSLKKKISKARQGYATWELERLKGEWLGEAPKQETTSVAKLMRQTFLGGLLKKWDDKEE